MELVLATQNLDKIKEIKDTFKNLGLKIFTFKDFSYFPSIEEDKETPYDNALKKARTIARFTGKIALADDSGLEVEVLGGAPGIFSHRFAGEKASYEDNNRKILSLLEGIPLDERKAAFRCLIAISDGGSKEKVVEGICKGRILQEMRGEKGFGYDPLFQPEGFTKTFAQMSLKEKNKISHRGKALKKARKVLEEWTNTTVIGLTGNIGSGKTTVARMFKELGAEIIEADKIGHDLIKKVEVKKNLIRTFGSSILDEKKEIERRKLGRIVFKNKKKLEKLNQILHPLIFAEIKKKIASTQARIVIIDAAILLEAGWNSLVDKVLVVSTSYEAQLKRIKESTRFSSEEIEGIMQAQGPQDKKIQRADFLIRNEGSLKETKRQVEQIWEKELPKPGLN